MSRDCKMVNINVPILYALDKFTFKELMLSPDLNLDYH